MGADELNQTARAIVAEHKGILAADESTGTIEKRFDSIGVESTEESRRAYRQLLFTTPGMEDSIGGVILYDETIRQAADDGTPFAEVLSAKGSIPGIKVDTGAHDLAGFPGEKVTEGLDGLRARLEEYRGSEPMLRVGQDKVRHWRLSDRIALVRSCVVDSVVHAPAHYQMNSGRMFMGYPSLGSWVTYGLGSESENLPAFVVMGQPQGTPEGGAPCWSSGFLPAAFQGTLFRPGPHPIVNLAPNDPGQDGHEPRVRLGL
jgi:hypothetical protein